MSPSLPFHSNLLKGHSLLPYWIMFLIPAFFAIASGPNLFINADGTRHLRLTVSWFVVVLLLALVIGFRYKVGGDWNSYFSYLLQGSLLSYRDLLTEDDPGYMALNILSNDFGWGMTGVNTMGAVIFGFGLVVFLRSLPRPWLGLACAIPYLVIVVAMGYTRQSIALGLVMIAFTALRRQKFAFFAIWVALGALFHKSAVLIFPIAAFTSDRIRLQGLGIIGLVGYAAYDILLADHSDHLVDIYIDQQLAESQGAFIRLAMNAIPAGLFIIFRKKFVMAPSEYRLWRAMAWVALAMFVALIITSYSTALDRMALYVMPLQLIFFSSLPDALGRSNGRNTVIVGVVLLYYALVLFAWLNFATHSTRWIPYRAGLVLN